MTTEFEFLLAIVSPAQSDDRAGRIGSRIAADGVDWTVLVELAELHGLMPQLHRRIVAGRFASKAAIPTKVLATLAEADRRNAGRNLVMAAELVRLIGCLRELGIRVLTFKGPTLALLAYGDLSLRQFNDLDLLVHADDFDRADRAIMAAGYRLRYPLSPGQRAYQARKRGQLIYRDEKGVLVELHSRLSAEDHQQSRFAFDDLWLRRQSVDLAGHRVETFGNEDLLLYLMVHAGKHTWDFLIWLCDCAQLAARQSCLNWPNLATLARDARCERMFGVAVYLLADLLGVQVAAEVGGRFTGDEVEVVAALATELSDSLISGGRRTPIRRARLDFTMQDRKRDGIRMVLSQVFDQQISDWQAVRLPDRWMGLYSLLRPLRLVFGRAREKS